MYKRIKDLREDSDYSQEYVSKVLGCSRSNYAMYESGDVKINIEQLVKLADIYDTSADYLLEITDFKFPASKPTKYRKEKFACNIKKLRVERKLHQSIIAEQVLHCTQASYSQYETGKRATNIDTIIALAKYYRVSVDYLVGRTEVTTPY